MIKSNTVKIIIAAVATILMFVVSSRNSRGRPEYFEHTENGITFKMMTVPKWEENGLAKIPVTIEGAVEDMLVPQLRKLGTLQKFHKTPLARYESVPMLVDDSGSGRFYAEIQTLARGDRAYYYIEVRDRSGGYRAKIPPGDEPFVLKYIGDVPAPVLIGHIALIFATVFFIMLATLNGLNLIRGDNDARPLSLSLFWATVVTFVGGYPIGFAMNWYAFAGVWEGVPFGTDATDNKTQLLFVYLLFAVLAAIGSLTRGKMGRDLFTPSGLGKVTIGALLVMLAVYLIPHSIQFSPELTKTVCWSFIGAVALLYFWALATATKRLKPERRSKKRKHKR